MCEYILSCCSSADLSKEHLKEAGIRYICPRFSLDDRLYTDNFGRDVGYEELYDAISEEAETKTTQLNIMDYYEYFNYFLEDGFDVLHVTISSGLSGAYGSAKAAAEMAAEQYPERKVFVLDSLCASSGYGLFMDELAKMKNEGVCIDELFAWGEKNRLKLNHWFFSTDLSSYIKGGRISKAAGIFGGVLNICPLLNMNREGRLKPREKVRTKNKVIEKIVDKMEEYARDGLKYNGKCYISMSACEEDAKRVAALIEGRFKKIEAPVLINNIGATIGCHTGPGTVALFFWGREREN